MFRRSIISCILANETKTWLILYEEFVEFQIMNEIQRAKIVLKILNKTYPKIEVPLKSRNVFTLLISVLLSAQCTDINVNNVTKNIYPRYYKPEHFVKLGQKKIEKLIKKIGIFRIKAKSIYNLSKILIKEHKGKVPNSFEDLEILPG